jgi:hypothetical protein
MTDLCQNDALIYKELLPKKSEEESIKLCFDKLERLGGKLPQALQNLRAYQAKMLELSTNILNEGRLKKKV